jgi:DNA-binding MarR family transcriptional regulator
VELDDRVDNIIEEWRHRHPDLDFSPLEVVARIVRAAHYLQARLDEIAAAYGLSHTGDLDVLTNLDRAGPPHERTPSELAQAQLVTTGGMTVRLNRLQRSGLIERRPNPDDGRGVLVRLTPMGRELANDALATVITAEADGIRGLDPSNQALLAGLLRELLVALGDTPAFRPPIAVRRDGT